MYKETGKIVFLTSNKNIDIDNATDIYVSRLVQYQCENFNERLLLSMLKIYHYI